MEEVSKSELWLSDAKAYAVDVFETSDVEDIRARVGLITFGFKNRIFYVMPRLYPEAFAAGKKALAKDRHRVISL